MTAKPRKCESGGTVEGRGEKDEGLKSQDDDDRLQPLAAEKLNFFLMTRRFHCMASMENVGKSYHFDSP